MGLPSILNGSIFIDNEDVSNFSYEKWTLIRREKISCVFQNLEIFNDLSIDDNIELVTDLYTNIDRSKIDYLFSSLGLSGLKKNKAKTLSLGEKQKLAICRALVRPFSLIILDEPFSHLDIKNIENICTVINEITNNNNANIILTSHSKAEMLKFHKEIFV